MIEICYKSLYVILGLFILSLFLYEIIKNNYIYKPKIIEGVEVSDAEIKKMSNVSSELQRMKLAQSNIIKNINSVKTNTNRMKKKLSDKSDEIQKNLKATEKQAEDAKKGKNVCPVC